MEDENLSDIEPIDTPINWDTTHENPVITTAGLYVPIIEYYLGYDLGYDLVWSHRSDYVNNISKNYTI